MPGTVAGGVMMTARSAVSGTRGDARIGFDAQHGVALGVDRINFAGETALDQVFQNGAADAAGIFRCADDGDGLRGKNRRQRAAGGVMQNIVGGFDGIGRFERCSYVLENCF